MIRAYTAAQIRAAESIALARLGESVLMSRAARAVADAVLSRLASPVPGRRVALLVGGGNNGGDALYAGALLCRRGCAVTAILAVPDRTHPAGRDALRSAGGRLVTSDEGRVGAVVRSADAVVDGLVGLGSRPPLRAPMDHLVGLAGSAPGWRVAVDLPSGVDADTGRTDGPAFAADLTVTIGAMKTGLLLADDLAGEIRVAPIGMDPGDLTPDAEPDVTALTESDVDALIPEPGADDDKFSSGVVGVTAGSTGYPGAAVLCTGASVYTRPGLVRYAGPQTTAVLARWPEVVAVDDPADAGRVQAWVVGPGMGTDGAALNRLRTVLAADVPVLVDADGLTLLYRTPSLLAERKRRGQVSLLTPHAGEFSRLFPDLDPIDRLTSVRAAAARTGAMVLLKGHRTVIATPDGRAAVNTVTSSWLATAGSGDVLSGVVGSLLAAGLEPLRAAALGAVLHGRAGQRAALAGHPGASALIPMLRATGAVP
jgi:hydroxyethylthiazole kinase-like uncharacterized protein yjeF